MGIMQVTSIYNYLIMNSWEYANAKKPWSFQLYSVTDTIMGSIRVEDSFMIPNIIHITLHIIILQVMEDDALCCIMFLRYNYD